MTDFEYDGLFTPDKPVVFAYHGYPWLIHRLTYRRTNHSNLHVRGYKEEGTTTTPFDMVMLNDLDRFHLVIDAIDRLPGLAGKADHVRQEMVDRQLQARRARVDREDGAQRFSTARPSRARTARPRRAPASTRGSAAAPRPCPAAGRPPLQLGPARGR